MLFVNNWGAIKELYPIRIEKPLDELADMLTAVIEGGIIMSRLLKNRSILTNQILQYRDHVRLAFGNA